MAEPEPTPPEEQHPATSLFQPSDRPDDPVPVVVLEDVNVDGAVVNCSAVPQETSSDYLCGLRPAAEANADGPTHEQIEINKMAEPTPPNEHYPAASQFQPFSSPDPVSMVVSEDVDVDSAVVGHNAVPQESGGIIGCRLDR
ncbi:hypothetical protein GUJ93_ZPchr0001g31886 [Zizania palustris]|uniref:Uncharacterized protein n=1 Tax=Zizania palustris TaxID=103762 RepID=A0A8J5RXC7_ZIZPA|nr:hypothetical protein GUJ93_ZPchr0001g31886 [Zizania palustris]